MARELCGLFVVPRIAPFQLMRYVYIAHVRSLSTDSLRINLYSAWKPKDDYGFNASVCVVQCNLYVTHTLNTF
jgi:hypothetical protein